MLLHAIIVAAGSSRRMGFDKLSAELDGTPVLTATIQAFLDCPAVNSLVVVADAERFAALMPANPNKPVVRVDGGAERFLSVAAGIAAVPENVHFIAVHDGARPLVTPELIERCLQAARTHDAAAAARRVTETVKRSDAEGFSREAVSRENLWLMETPQIFRASLLRRAYREAHDCGAKPTDEVSAVDLLDVATILVDSGAPNPKITFPADLAWAAKLRS
jgi:2-C-methyl-D-erythritol 4-phosphate cytidylyltransferase